MESLSKNLEEWYGPGNAALQKISIEEYYRDLPGAVILDVGNGGQSAEQQLGPELSTKIARFIGADKSFEMLSRLGDHEKILCDANAIPLADNSVDYCLLNNVIHHFGFNRADGFGSAVSGAIGECLRVARRGIIIVEMTVPRWVQQIESAMVGLTGGMATFVFNADTLRGLLQGAEAVEVTKFKTVRLGELVGDWTLFRAMITVPIKVPAGLIPYTYVFCEVRKVGR
ncbi:Methyltransferase domain-containing protein [Rhodospirillales bacterium URHD0017]|nr:Methyltransferase domain-containing protein [Rhodospirillales bacterium URHD0017]